LLLGYVLAGIILVLSPERLSRFSEDRSLTVARSVKAMRAIVV